MKWDGQTVTVVCSIILAFCALGVMMQSGFAEINSDIRDLRTDTGNLHTRIDDVEIGLRQEIGNVDNRLREMAVSVDSRLDNIENRLTRVEVHLFGFESESPQTP